jgi:uncharacterized membrane protein YfcA
MSRRLRTRWCAVLPASDLIAPAIGTLFIFLAAIVRGYSGFGFSLLAITSLSLVYDPVVVIPAVFLMEIAASIHLLPSVWKDVHWRSLAPLIAGTALGTPFGVYALANVAPAPMKIALAAFVILAALLLWRGFALKAVPATPATLAIGAGAGVANGAFGIGGPPVILFYFATPAGNAVGRASLVVYFLVTDALGLGVLGANGLLSLDNVKLAVLFLPALVAGVWLGARSFKAANPETFRKWVLVILIVLAALTALQGFSAAFK